MQETLKGFGGKLKEFFAKMSKKTRIILGCALGAVILAGVIFAVAMSHRPYAVLFTGLSPPSLLICGITARLIFRYRARTRFWCPRRRRSS